MEKTDLQHRLHTFRARFAAGLPTRLERLHGHWREASDPTRRERALKALHREAHNLAGGSASFGYQRLGTVARRLEERAGALAEGRRAFAAECEELERDLGTLAGVIAEKVGRNGD